MSGRKPKPIEARLREIELRIEKRTQKIATEQQRLEADKLLYAELLSQRVVGCATERSLAFPQVESLLEKLEQRIPAPVSIDAPDAKPKQAPADDITLLKFFVSMPEREQIYKNMERAHFQNFSSFARKMLLDGYVIVWTFPEITALVKELGFINRNMNQIVKRANVSGSIHALDFLEYQKQWREANSTLQKLISQLLRVQG